MVLLVLGMFVIVFLAGALVVSMQNECSDCHNDNRTNTMCEDCEYYKDSLRYDYVTYCKTHNHFKKKEK